MRGKRRCPVSRGLHIPGSLLSRGTDLIGENDQRVFLGKQVDWAKKHCKCEECKPRAANGVRAFDCPANPRSYAMSDGYVPLDVTCTVKMQTVGTAGTTRTVASVTTLAQGRRGAVATSRQHTT
jgi:hypothetical protein